MMNEEIARVLTGLEKHNMTGYYVENEGELLALLSSLLRKGEVVGCGDSLTLEQTGVFTYLKSGTVTFLDKHNPQLTSEEKRELYLQNFRADTFITGTNALTIDGQLFNIDGNGSRVAPMLYGPKQVIVVVGINKLVQSVEEAIVRARQVAAPLDAKRLDKATPCVTLGRCVDCKHEQRICNSFVLLSRQFIKGRIKVILINGHYGY